MSLKVTKEQARRFLLQKQLLWPPKSLAGEDAIQTVFQSLRVVQYDPLNPCGRNADLVLQARIKDYHPDDYQKWLYKEKKGIECYDKELCIIPIEDVALTFHSHEKFAQHSRIVNFFKEYQKDIELLEKRIMREGPLSASDIKDDRKVESNWMDNARFARFALDSLWWLGRLVIVKRANGRKYYDVPKNVYGASHGFVPGEKYEIAQEHVLRRVKSVGILSASGSGPAWQGIGSAKENKEIIRTLVMVEKVVEVEVVDSKIRYIINANDKELLLSAISQMPYAKYMVFIAPLDTLMWDRNMIEDFFGFYYRWEVYTPEKKRQYGYYVLPILYGDELIGRVEPVFDKKKKKLSIKNLWKEREWNKDEEQAYKKVVEEFGKYLLT